MIKRVTTYAFVQQIIIFGPNNLNTYTIFNVAKDRFESQTGHDKLIPGIIKHILLRNFKRK